MRVHNYENRIRIIRAGLRDSLLLFREFRRPLVLFLGLIIIFGVAYYQASILANEPCNSLAEAFYIILTLTVFQPAAEFPRTWYLQIFYFIVPIIGISILAQGVADFGAMFFNRKARRKEWEMAVASTFTNHIVLIGLGHLGFRVTSKLREMNLDVVAVEVDPKPNLLQEIQNYDVPVIQGDATHTNILTAAGIAKAKTIILCTQNDSLNLQIALKARSINSKIEVVIRIFEDDFADALQKQFGFKAFSATAIAAPIFAASAARVDITPPIVIDGNPNVLAKFDINEKSDLLGESIFEIEENYRLSIVLLHRQGRTIPHPPGTEKLQPGDNIAILGHPNQISKLLHGKDRK